MYHSPKRGWACDSPERPKRRKHNPQLPRFSVMRSTNRPTWRTKNRRGKKRPNTTARKTWSLPINTSSTGRPLAKFWKILNNADDHSELTNVENRRIELEPSNQRPSHPVRYRAGLDTADSKTRRPEHARQESGHPSQLKWSASIIFALKRYRSLRLSADYRELN